MIGNTYYWNAVDAAEDKSTSQTARCIIMALPKELTQEQNIELIRNYCQTSFVDRGMIAETEQKQLEAEVIRLREEIEVQEKQNEFVEQFIQRLKDHSLEIDKLDGYILHELIEAIYVEAPDKSSGHRTQALHIKYKGIGFIPIHELMTKETARPKPRRKPWKHYVFVFLNLILFYRAPANAGKPL